MPYIHVRWDGGTLHFLNSSIENPVLFHKLSTSYTFYFYGLTQDDLVFSTEDSTTGAGPPVMVNGTLVIDANTPRRFYVRHTSMATAANYFTVTSDSVFKHSDRGVYLEETTMPVNSTEVYADGSSEPYTTLTLAVREEADKVAWVNDTNSHSIISFVSSVGVLNRIPASLSSGWVTHKVDVDQLVVGETVTLKFHSTHESIDNQLFTSKMQPTVEDQEEYDDGIERKEVTIEIDLGNMKSVDFLTKVPEEYDILKYNGTKWVAASDKIIHDSDVFYDLATIDTGHVLAWDADAFKQSSSPLPPSILDTSVSSAGEILVSTGEVWTNVVPNLNLNSDLQYDPETITAGKALVWDVDLAQFIPGEGVVPPVEFDATAMVDGQILVWDTDKFIPTISPLPAVITDTTTVQDGETLSFQGGEWVSKVPGLNDNFDAQYDPATITQGQILVWDTDKFVPGTTGFSSVPPLDGEILVFDDASGLWTPVTHYDCHLTKLNFLNGSLFATVSGCKIEGEFGLRFLHEDSFINSFTVEKYAFATTNLNFINESNENFTIFRRDELNVNTLLNIFNSPSIIFSELSGGEEYPPSAPFSIQYTTYTQLSLSAYPDTLHWRARDTLDVGSGIFNIRANDELLFSPTPSAYYLEELEPTVRAVGIDHYGFGYNTYSLSTSPTGHIVSSSETAFNTETTFYPFVENILRTHDGVWYVTFHENLDRWNIDTYVDPPFAPPSTAKEKNFIQEHLDGNLTLFPPAAIRAHFGRTPFSRSDKGFTSGFADAGGYGQYYYFFYNGDIFYLPDVCNEAEIFLTHSDGVTKIQELSIDQNLSIFQSATSERCIAWVEGGDDVSPESGWRLYEQDIPFDFRVIVNESTAQAVAARAHIRENSSLYPFTAAATYLPEFGKWSNVHFPLCTPRGTIIREYKEAGSDEFPNLGTFRNDVLYRFTLREGPEPGGQVEYPSWQNNEKSISLVYWDENPAIANRELLPFRSKYWYPYTGDITLLNDGDEIEIRSNYTENFFMRKLMKGPELYPAPTNESNPLVVYGNGSTYGDMLVTTTINLENMNDTDFSVSPQVGQILTMGSAGKWIAQNDSLSNNEDVNLTVAPADNQVLSFDISTGKWIPRDPVLVQDYYATSIDIGDNGVLTALVTNEVDGEVKSINTTVNLNNLGDVSIPTTPEEGDILTYNASGNFMPGKQYILNALDVNYNATTMINNHVLVWNSTSKIFQESQGILPHFEFSNAVGGDILIMDGGVWKNYSPHLSINSDVDFDETSIRDGSFLTWSGDKFVESSFAFDLTDLLNGDLLRFNQLTNKFENFTPVVGDQGTSTDPSTTTELSNVTIQDGIIEFGSTTPEYITFSF